MHKQLFQTGEFRNPSAQWRGKPFWSWNGKLQKEELIRQIHVLKKWAWLSAILDKSP